MKLKPGKWALLALKALKQAAYQVRRDHKEKNIPMVVYEKGKVKWIPAKDIKL